MAVPAFGLRGRSRPARVGFLVRSGSSCSVVCRLRFCLVLLLRSLSRFPRRRSLSRPVSAGRTRVRPCSRPLSFVALCASPLAFFFRGCLSRSPPPSPAASPAVLSRRRLRCVRGLVCRWPRPRPAFSPRPRPAPARSRSLPGPIWLGHSPGFSSGRRPACGHFGCSGLLVGGVQPDAKPLSSLPNFFSAFGLFQSGRSGFLEFTMGIFFLENSLPHRGRALPPLRPAIRTRGRCIYGRFT